MNEKQANKWLKKVKGEKIRMDCWPKDHYIVPTGKWFDNGYTFPYYWKFEGVDQDNEKYGHYVMGGFSANIFGRYWEYKKSPITQVIEFIKKLVK